MGRSLENRRARARVDEEMRNTELEEEQKWKNRRKQG